MKVAKNKNKIWFGPFLFLLMKLMDVLVFKFGFGLLLDVIKD